MNQVAEDKMPTGTMAGTPQVLLAHHLKQLKLPLCCGNMRSWRVNVHATGSIIADTCFASSNLS